MSVLSDHFQAEDVIRLRNEFKHGFLEMDISPRQGVWLAGILREFDVKGMNTPCTPSSVDFIKRMMDRMNETCEGN